MPTRPLRLTLIALAIGTLLAACTLVPTPNPFDTPLEPGGTTITDEDVYLGATDGALEGTRTFAIDEVSMPTETGSFPDADVLSDFVALAVEDGFSTPDESPLLVGLPVPAGTDTANLALAVLVPAEAIHDDTRGSDTPPEPRDTWTLVEGSYDPDGGRLVTAFTELPEGGVTLAVVASEDFGSPEVGPSLDGQQGIGFRAPCVGFGKLDRDAECTAADSATMATELATVFDDLDSRGFKKPKLRIAMRVVSVIPPIAEPLGYVVQLRPFITDGDEGDLCLVDSQGSGNHGRYTRHLKRAVVCWGDPVESLASSAASYLDGRIDTLRHEYFHAIQYAYTGDATSWFKESTAVAAQDSLDTMVRDTGRGVRDVDVRMNDRPQMYSLQDFWIYLGMRFGLSIADVIPFLEAGGDEAALDQVFASDYPGLGGLGDAFWAWVKNQTFEKEFALGGNGFATLCGLDTDGSGNYFALRNPIGAPIEVSYDFTAPPADQNRALNPLSARIFQLDFGPLPATTYSTTVTVSGGVASHFYPDAQAGTPACIGDPDSSTLTLTVNPGQPQTHFLLIANTDPNSIATAVVDFEGNDGPAIEIVSPLQNATFDENDIIDFQAIASGFTGADPDQVVITWSYERDGIPITIGTSGSSEVLSERLCDGSYTMTATALDAGSSATISDTVSFVVSDLGFDGNPPAQCRPDIEILEPSAGQTFAVGQTISLRAAIDDDDPTTDAPLYPITWRDGGPSGTILGTSLESSTKLGEGVHQIYVSYGVASDTVTITIEAGNPPTATITFPSDDEVFIPWTDIEGCSDTYTLSGLGTDTEDGALTGSELSWSVRVNGGALFPLGTGSPVDLFISCGNSYEVTLTVTDSTGLQDNDTVTITADAPPS